VLVYFIQIFLPEPFVEIPHPLDEFPVNFFNASFTHIGSGFSPVHNKAFDYPEQAHRPGEIQKYHGAAPGQAYIQKTVKITINNPFVLHDDFGNLPVKCILRHFHPTGKPE
jgi:hypothetical protein